MGMFAGIIGLMGLMFAELWRFFVVDLLSVLRLWAFDALDDGGGRIGEWEGVLLLVMFN
jgi:hypothetical protein